MMVETFCLPVHAAAALGVGITELDLPRVGLGVSGDVIWIDPRFIEVRRQREVIARQLAEHRHDIHADLHHKPARVSDELKMIRRRERKRARKARLKAMRASVV